MARHHRKEIILGGKKLWQLSVDQIVDFASRPGHTRYNSGAEQDYRRNRNLLEAFGERSVCTTVELVDAYHHQNRDDFSKEFDALRLGEMLGFALENGIVRYEIGWRLVHRELQFECVGPADKQRAIRVRNVPTKDAEENARLWAREQKRREKARLKRLGQHKSSIANWLNGGILRTAADTPLDGPLERFAFGDFQTIGAVAQMIVDAVDGMDLKEAAEIDAYLGNIWIKRPADDFSKRRPRPAPVDDAVLGDLYL